MKKALLFSLAAVCATFSASAQINKGSTYVGGNLGFYSSKTNYEQPITDGKTSVVNLLPSVGFAYKDNRVWGVYLNYSHNESNVGTNDVNATSNLYGIGTFLRQYKPIGKGFFVFAQENLAFSYTDDKAIQSASYVTETKSYQVSLGLTPGVAYDVSKKFQLELTLNNIFSAGYSHARQTEALTGSSPYATVYHQNNFNLSGNLGQLAQVGDIAIGARFVLGR